jgi:phosphoribosylanthranilate isomerase
VRVRVKICGITRLEDAALAVELGADAIGFVLWPGSPRAVNSELARAIAEHIPKSVTRVGVFVDPIPSDVAWLVESIGLDTVQLHGQEAVESYEWIGANLVKAVRLDTDQDIERAADLPQFVTPLVDATDRHLIGGTGQLADWRRAARLAARRPIMLAGGLVASNVAEAVRSVRPWAVDVSSGVERYPGVKDADRMIRFFQAVAVVNVEAV